MKRVVSVLMLVFILVGCEGQAHADGGDSSFFYDVTGDLVEAPSGVKSRHRLTTEKELGDPQ